MHVWELLVSGHKLTQSVTISRKQSPPIIQKNIKLDTCVAFVCICFLSGTELEGCTRISTNATPPKFPIAQLIYVNTHGHNANHTVNRFGEQQLELCDSRGEFAMVMRSTICSFVAARESRHRIHIPSLPAGHNGRKDHAEPCWGAPFVAL